MAAFVSHRTPAGSIRMEQVRHLGLYRDADACAVQDAVTSHVIMPAAVT